MSLRDKILQIASESDKTLDELGKELNISKAGISRHLRKTRDINSLITIANLFGYHIELEHKTNQTKLVMTTEDVAK